MFNKCFFNYLEPKNLSSGIYTDSGILKHWNLLVDSHCCFDDLWERNHWFSMSRKGWWSPMSFWIRGEGFMFNNATGRLLTGSLPLRSEKDLRDHQFSPLAPRFPQEQAEQASATELISEPKPGPGCPNSQPTGKTPMPTSSKSFFNFPAKS